MSLGQPLPCRQEAATTSCCNHPIRPAILEMHWPSCLAITMRCLSKSHRSSPCARFFTLHWVLTIRLLPNISDPSTGATVMRKLMLFILSVSGFMLWLISVYRNDFYYYDINGERKPKDYPWLQNWIITMNSILSACQYKTQGAKFLFQNWQKNGIRLSNYVGGLIQHNSVTMPKGRLAIFI